MSSKNHIFRVKIYHFINRQSLSSIIREDYTIDVYTKKSAYYGLFHDVTIPNHMLDPVYRTHTILSHQTYIIVEFTQYVSVENCSATWLSD